MLVPPLKKSTSIELARRLITYIEKAHSPAEAASQSEAINKLGDIRLTCIQVKEPNEAGINLLIRYWAQLCLLEKRVDFEKVNLQFIWYEAYKGYSSMSPATGRTASTALGLELGAILFNCGALCAQAADRDYARPAADSIKAAAAGFRRAAGLFSGAREALAPLTTGVTVDIGAEGLRMLENLCLAHAQRCVYESGRRQGMSGGTLAKVAAGAAELYGTALSLTMGPTSDLGRHLLGVAKGAWSAEVAEDLREGRSVGNALRTVAHWLRTLKVDKVNRDPIHALLKASLSAAELRVAGLPAVRAQVDALLEDLRLARAVFEEAEKPRVHDALAKEQRKA
eukprot:CAMPEP_0172189988 /NCGR_PEP_ID=MMETSP1050-20130122/22852_1 /TAXON_ID=233186 /ORGANISM="Cryptomonas curvata, Strain CCAP979/52" /LENGTH=339 /DNA_ID=CAMNT_0012864789 /DNA_START=93 /DNA_END=1109 /DNA_ORIENTATION=+